MTEYSRRRFGIGVAGISCFSASCFQAHARQPVPRFEISATVGAASSTQKDVNEDAEACSVSNALFKKICLESGLRDCLGTQIRICRAEDEYALYTIVEQTEDAGDLLRLSKAARERIGTTSVDFPVLLRPALAPIPMTDAQAEAAGEFIERIEDPGAHQGLLVLAPHGGDIETNTDLQARYLMSKLHGHDVSSWICKGWSNKGAAIRWHIASTAISPKSFPGLAQITRRSYAYSVAFHGMASPGVLIGGAGPTELKELLRDRIQSLVEDVETVRLASEDEMIGGNSVRNVTNWVTTEGAGGIQIEQGLDIRGTLLLEVTDIVAEVFAGLV